jgi:hypothetical protein
MLLFLKKYQNTKNKKKSKYKWTKGPKVKRKKMMDQRKFKLLGDQAIKGKMTKLFYL